MSRRLTVDLGFTPRPWQKECVDNLSRFTVLALHRRAGKTTLAIMLLIREALNCKQDLGLFVYVSPYLKQSKSIMWSALKARLEPLRQHKAVEILEAELTVRFLHNGAMIRVFGADNPHALRGLRVDMAVLDEVAQIKPDVWSDVLIPALSDRKGRMLAIGTPHGVNLFSEMFFKAQVTPDWSSRSYTCYDTDALDEDEILRLKRDMADSAFAREMLCDFSAAGDDQLISLNEATEASRRIIVDSEIMHASRILGVDVARFGDDRSVIFKRQGLQALEPIILRDLDNMQLAARVAQEITRWEADACFIDAGGGSGVIDRLRQLGLSPIEVNFGGKASDPRYVNKRTEMWFDLRDWMRSGGAIPASTALLQELGTPTYHYDAANRICLESKDDIKKRLQGGASPDLADALALTFASPVMPRHQFAGGPRKVAMVITEYDPFA